MCKNFHITYFCILLMLNCATSKIMISVPPESEWFVFESRGNIFSLKYPPLIKYIPQQGIDSYIGSFEGPGLKLHFDYGWYNSPMPDDKKFPQYTHYIAKWDTINGIPVQFVKYCKKEKRYARVFFLNVDPPADLLIKAECSSEEAQELTWHIARTVDFGK